MRGGDASRICLLAQRRCAGSLCAAFQTEAPSKGTIRENPPGASRRAQQPGLCRVLPIGRPLFRRHRRLLRLPRLRAAVQLLSPSGDAHMVSRQLRPVRAAQFARRGKSRCRATRDAGGLVSSSPATAPVRPDGRGTFRCRHRLRAVKLGRNRVGLHSEPSSLRAVQPSDVAVAASSLHDKRRLDQPLAVLIPDLVADFMEREEHRDGEWQPRRETDDHCLAPNPRSTGVMKHRHRGNSPGKIHFFSWGSNQPVLRSNRLPSFAWCDGLGSRPA